MPKVVCNIGVIGSGKNFRAKQLVDQGYVQINFADNLRELAWEILGWRPFLKEDYEKFKKRSIVFTIDGDINDITGREFLQNLGSAMRKRNADYLSDPWFDSVYKKLSENKNVVCSDLRALNELKAALDFLQETLHNDGSYSSTWALCDVEFIFCDYRSERYNATNSHESEHLAQRILKDGHKDGDILSIEYLQGLLK